MNDRFLTTRELADYLSVSCETVLRWHRSGKLPGGRRFNGTNCLRFRESVVEAWLEGAEPESDFARETSAR